MSALGLRRNGTIKANRRNKNYASMHAALTAEVRRKHPEQDFQIKLVRDLQSILRPSVFFTAFPAGGGGKKRGAFLKAMGLKAGCGDLLFIHEGRVFWMELKTPKGRLSPNQIGTRLAIRQAGSHVETVRSFDEALECLAIWNIPISPAQKVA